MDVDKKLGMSLDDLIKKTRPAKKATGKGAAVKKAGGQKKKTGVVTSKKVVKKGQLGVRKSLDKNDRREKPARKTERMVVDRRMSDSKPSRAVVVKKGPNAPESSRKIKIQNIPYDLTWKDIKAALSDVGKIERCDVEHGEALLTFATHKEAARAVQNYDGGDMNGRRIRVALM